jgi:putative ABC transport system permease protein
MKLLPARPLRAAEWLLRRMANNERRAAIIGDLEEEFAETAAARGVLRAHLRHARLILVSLPSFVRDHLYWSQLMLKNYLKITIRSLRKQSAYSMINIGGLAVGLACTLLILLWVQYERSFDNFHGKRAELYRIINHQQRNGVERDLSGAPALLGPALKDDFPEIRDYARVLSYQPFCSTDGAGAAEFQTRLVQVDPQFFRLFDFPFVQGRPETALSDPYSVVINEKTARAMFGTADPLGKTMIVGGDDKLSLKVTGVMKNIPEISHLQFDAAIPLDSYRAKKPEPFFNDWKNYFMATYVWLDRNADVPKLNAKLTAFARAREGAKPQHQIWLQPLNKIHLDSRIFSDLGNAGAGDSRTLALFSLIAFVVLIIACVNFMNLTTARAFARAKEVGVRKVNGATKRDLIKQFLAETLGLFALAMALGFILLNLLLPFLRSLTGRQLVLGVLSRTQILLTVAGITVVSALAAGILPALFLASFQPGDILKSQRPSGRGSLLGLRRALLSGQFIAAAVLIGMTGIVFHQLHFLKTKDLGYDRSHIIEIDYSPELAGRNEAWKNDLLAYADVWGATVSQSTYNFGASYKKYVGTWEGKADTAEVRFYSYNVDYDFLRTYGVPLKAGRFFAQSSSADARTLVINETAARIMGLADPIGKRLTIFQRPYTIIGVLADFNATSLRTAIDPTIFYLNRPNSGLDAYPALTVRLNPANVPGALRHIESVWRKYCPGKPFQYHFIDDILRTEFYANDEIFGRMMAGFAVLALFVAGLGLFGLVAFGAERRTREIGIRKILGATRVQILTLMSKDVIPVVIVSNIIAWPLILLFSRGWLGEFAYRIGYAWWLIGLTVLATAMIALATIGYHGLNASRKNPAVCLRCE